MALVKDTHNADTKLVNLGRDPHAHHGSVNPPVHHTSTVIFENFAQMEDYDSGNLDCGSAGYGRFGTPSVWALEESLSELEGSYRSWVTASGCSAYVTALLSCLNAGDHLLMTDCCYGPNRKFCDQELSRMGVEVTYYDPTINENVAGLFKDNTKVVFVESPGSLTFEVQDIPAIAKVAHEKGITVIADNTWGTPYFSKPFELGVDIALHSATKYISGHSDLIMGLISANESHADRVNRVMRNIGATPSGDNCYLALRGLRTMAVRMKHQQESALKVARWLEKHSKVDRLLCPFLEKDPGHALWKRDFAGAASLFAFTLPAGTARDQVAAFMDSLTLFGMGYSWGGFESLTITYQPHQIRTAMKEKWSPETRVIRLHIGLEDTDDLIADLDQAFTKI